AIQIDIGVMFRIGKSVMQAFAGIFFEVQASDSNSLSGSIAGRYLDVTVLSHRLVVLRNLVSLGKIRIKIVLAREDRDLADLAIQRHGCANRVLDTLAIQYW